MAFNPKSILSIDGDADIFIAAEFVKKRDHLELVNYKTARSINDIVAAFPPQDRLVVVSLPTQNIFVKSFPVSVSLVKSRDQKKDIAVFLARQNLPIRLDECFWHAFFSPGHLNFIAARKDAIDRSLRGITQAGYAVTAAVPSFLALSNLVAFLHGDKERVFIVNVRGESSDLIVAENRRLWVYPVPVGRRVAAAGGAFMDEIRRMLNIHLMQNAAAGKSRPVMYISGVPALDVLIGAARQAFPEYDVTRLEPFKKISAAVSVPLDEVSPMEVALGLGVTAARLPRVEPVNFIGDKVRLERFASRFNFAERVAAAAAVCVLIVLCGLNVNEAIGLRRAGALAGESKEQVVSFVPKLKDLKAQKASLSKAQIYLQQKLDSSGTYLRALAAVAEALPQSLRVDDFEAKSVAAGQLDVFLGGTAAEYNGINEFLIKLKARQDVHDVKVVASTLPDTAASAQGIGFKVRFSLE